MRPTTPLLAAVLMLAGCVHNPIDPNAPADAQQALTSQGAWRLLQATRADGSRIEALFAPGASVRLQFADDRVTVYGGCNTLMGAYALDLHTLRIGALASTRMACDAQRMAVDAAIQAQLGAALALRWAAGGQRLWLHPADGGTLLFEAVPLE